MLVLLKQAVIGCGIVFSSLAGLMSSAGLVNTADQEGLSGILAPEIPEGLSDEDFEVLDGNWAEWSAAAAADVARLYSEEPLTLQQQQEALDAIASRLRVMETALGDDAYSMIHRPLADLHGKLQRRYDVAVAALKTLQLNPNAARQAQIRRSLDGVLSAQNDLAGYLKTLQGGTPWLAYIGADDLAAKLDGKGEADALKLLTGIEQKIAHRSELSLEEQQTFLGERPFQTLAETIAAYRDATLIQVHAPDDAALRKALHDLVAALESYEASNSSADAAAARGAFDRVRGLAADGGELVSDALRRDYFNYNLHVVFAETLLNKFVAEERTENGPVDDCILGAKVDGTQSTTTDVGLDILRSRDRIRFDLIANGHVCSDTQGVTDQATVYTLGSHYFTAKKEVDFDGYTFSTQKARIGVNANNQTYDVSTQLDGIPLLNMFGKIIARSETARRRPEAEAIAASRISDRVLPKMDSETDKAFAKATTDLNDSFYADLKKGNLYPSAMTFESTDDHISFDTRTMEAGELAGSRPNGFAPADKGATIEVHESAVNNLFDRVGIAGKSLTEDEFARLMADYMEKTFGRKIEAIERPKDYEGDNTRFNFAKEDPIRVKFEGGAVILTIRAGLKREGEDDIPVQEIEVPITFTVDGDMIVAEAADASDIAVRPVERPDSIQVQIARATAIRKKVSDSLPRRELDRAFDVHLNEKQVDLQITEIVFLNGWLRVVAE